MGKVIYLDHASTTPADPEVVAAMLPWHSEEFGNPSSLYSLGLTAADAVQQARESIAQTIGAEADEIYFTSGGTESDNWAVLGVAHAKREKGNHIITSKIEHHAILEPCHFLEKQGFEVTYLDVDQYGLVDPDDVRKAITDRTTLITVMHANNEIGTIEPVEEIGAIAREKGIHFHTDAVQTVGRIPVNVVDIKADSLALSGHKFYGPKGVGVMYIRKGARVQPFMLGGGQERGKRPGTHNLPGIVGLGKAVELMTTEMEPLAMCLTRQRDRLTSGILESIPDTRLNGHPTKRLPNNVNVSVAGIEGESMIMLLNAKGICASTGSACTSDSLEPSHVLLAIGLPHELAHASLRLTLGKCIIEHHIDYVLETLPGIVNRLREMSPLYEKSGVG